MDTKHILNQLRAERARLDSAIRAIEAISADGARPSTTASTIGKKRRMSTTARKRLSELLKKRWAEGRMKRQSKRRANAVARSRVPKTAKSKRALTAAGRKRLSQMMKKRWAQREGAAKPHSSGKHGVAKQAVKTIAPANVEARA